MQSKIENTIIKALNPELLEVVNESYKHNVPKDSESHFKILAISEKFTNLSKMTRHKMLFKLLESEFKSIHALSLALYTPEEWQQKPNKQHTTPACAHKDS
jgi:BolA protein